MQQADLHRVFMGFLLQTKGMQLSEAATWVNLILALGVLVHCHGEDLNINYTTTMLTIQTQQYNSQWLLLPS